MIMSVYGPLIKHGSDGSVQVLICFKILPICINIYLSQWFSGSSYFKICNYKILFHFQSIIWQLHSALTATSELFSGILLECITVSVERLLGHVQKKACPNIPVGTIIVLGLLFKLGDCCIINLVKVMMFHK